VPEDSGIRETVNVSLLIKKERFYMRVVIYVLALVLVIFTGQESLGQEAEGNNDYQYALIEAVRQKNLGSLPEAIKLYKLVIKERPDCQVAYYELGGIYLMSNQVELAVPNLKKAYEFDTENEWYFLAYLNSLGVGKQYDEMELILKEKAKNNPADVELEYQLATVYLSQERHKKAIRMLESIEKNKGFSEKVTLLKASIYESEEEYELALIELEKVMVLFPEAIQFRIVAAELCMKSGKEEVAAHYYLDLLDVDSTNIYALTNLTDYYRNRELYDSSFIYLNKSFSSNMIDARRKMAIISYYLSDEKFRTAYPQQLESLLEVLIVAHPEEYDVRLMASDFYIQQRSYKKAFWNLKVYLKKGGSSYPLYMQAIMLANASGLNQELVDITGVAMKVYPDSLDIRFFRGIGMYETANYQALIVNYEGISLDEFSTIEYVSQAKMLIAEAYYRLGEYGVSDSLFESLIESEPDNFMVLNNYSYYLAQRGDKLSEAACWSKKTIENNPDNATFLDTYAWILYKLGEYDEAEKYILMAMEKGGENDPDVNEHAGDIQAALGSMALASSYYLKARVLGGDPEALEKKIEFLNSGENE
jgi:tetratricopeptide (TPR) repeat protein